MPATRARSIAPRFDSFITPSPPRARHTYSSDSLTFSDVETTMPLTVKRKDKPQAIDPDEIIEISDDDDDPPPHSKSQVSIIADFRRQINKLREVCHLSVHFNAIFDASGALCSGKCQAQERS